MNTEANPSVRTDALVATIVLAALGLLWLVFRLYWQGLLLLVAAGGVAYLGVRRARGDVQSEAQPATSKPEQRARADKPRGSKSGKKRRRRK
jgi:hypothetical protein